ncbi:MAG: MFS transporter [Deltaproteobacteria bacterium]|nr:MFS transporter [Deltaproteobacteria bacterium]
MSEAPQGEREPAERAPVTVAWVSTTYFAEGLPYSIVHQVASQLFTAMNASLESIGLVSLYGLAWNFKFVWSPLVDLFSTARRWLVVLEVLLAAAIVWMAWPAQQGHLPTVAKILVLVAVLAATHDIAIDGYYLRALEQQRQAAYAGLRVAAYRVALLVGNGALVWVAGKVSWRVCFLLGGALMGLLALMHQAVLPVIQAPDKTAQERAEPKLPKLVDAFVSFFLQPGIILAIAFVLVYRLGDAMMFSMSTPLLRDLGMDTSMRAVVSGMIGTPVGIAATIASGWWISRQGLRRTLIPIAAIQAGALPLYAIVAWVRPPTPVIIAAVLVEQIAAGVGTAGFSVYLMRLCAGKYKAAHFAIATALMSLAATLSGSASGFLATRVGYTWFFSIAAMAALPGLALSWVVAKRLEK